MSPDWALMKGILCELGSDDGQADEQLAGRLDATIADVSRAVRILYRRRELDFCWGYCVMPARASGSRRAA